MILFLQKIGSSEEPILEFHYLGGDSEYGKIYLQNVSSGEQLEGTILFEETITLSVSKGGEFKMENYDILGPIPSSCTNSSGSVAGCLTGL